MNETLQPALHPDAEQLAAFAEQCLPEHERAQTMAHLAGCAACREVVFLAQQGEPEPVAMPAAARRPWFSGWNLAWPAGAALAAIVWFSVHLHTLAGPPGSAPEDTTASVEAPKPVPILPVQPQADVPAKSVPAPPQPVFGEEEKRAPAAIARPEPAMARKAESGGAAAAEVMAAPRMAGAVRAAPPGALSQSARDRTTLDGNQDAVVTEAPMSNALPLMTAKPAGQTAAGTAFTAAATPSVAPDRQAVAGSPAPVRAAPSALSPPRSSAPPGEKIPAQRNESVTVTADSTVSATLDSAQITALPPLPSGMPVESQAMRGGRSVAIDRNGAAFFSKDSGRHWKPVKAQWTGRAVRVSTNTGKGPAFELTTDGNMTWTSSEGQRWKAK